METNRTNAKAKIVLILKWIFSILFILGALGAILNKGIISATFFFLFAMLLFPPLSETLNRIPALKNNGIKTCILILFFVLAAIFNPNSSSGKTENKAVTTRQKPISNKVGNQKSIDKPIIDGAISYKGLNSIKPADIYINFENKGFTIDKKISTDGSFFYCTKEEAGIKYDVTIYAENNVNEVTEIKLNAFRDQANLNTSIDIKPFLKYGVSIPYDAAEIEKAQDFIERNFNINKASITISGVKFTIYCPTEFVRLVTIKNE